jgi:hypothetical protein
MTAKFEEQAIHAGQWGYHSWKPELIMRWGFVCQGRAWFSPRGLSVDTLDGRVQRREVACCACPGINLLGQTGSPISSSSHLDPAALSRECWSVLEGLTRSNSSTMINLACSRGCRNPAFASDTSARNSSLVSFTVSLTIRCMAHSVNEMWLAGSPATSSSRIGPRNRYS